MNNPTTTTPTTSTPVAELDSQLNDMIEQGDALEAFEKFYADDIVMLEGTDRFEGKKTNRTREQDFFSKITDFRAGKLMDSAVGNGVTYSTWHFDYTHSEWGDVKYDQVAERHWKDGRIVKERFYRA